MGPALARLEGRTDKIVINYAVLRLAAACAGTREDHGDTSSPGGQLLRLLEEISSGHLNCDARRHPLHSTGTELPSVAYRTGIVTSADFVDNNSGEGRITLS
jgi:hypothetical protein